MNQYTIWKVSNGYLLLPQGAGANGTITSEEASRGSVFKTLKEFAEYKPKRVRNRKKQPTKVTPETFEQLKGN